MPNAVLSVVVVALVVTLLVEVPIVAAFYPRQRRRMAITCAVATVASSLVVNAALRVVTSRSDAPLPVSIAAGQLVAMLLEALAYYAVARPRELRRALTAAAAANIASYAAGLLLGQIG